MDQTSIYITGRVIFKPTVIEFTHSTINIYLEEISYADADAITLAHITIPNVSHAATGDTIIPFRIELSNKIEIKDTADYSVRVWVNLSSNGTAEIGDLFSDTTERVLSYGYGNQVEVIFH